MKLTVFGKDCLRCIYFDDSVETFDNPKPLCKFKNKKFYWGQRIPCENKTVEKKG